MPRIYPQWEAIALRKRIEDRKKKPLIVPVREQKQLDLVRELFQEYAASLGFELSFQNFEEELRTLPDKYAPPEGEILLAFVDGIPAGCIALHALPDGVGELKRLFVRDAFRGLGIGKKLILHMIDEAKLRNYPAVRLDTLPSMKEAICLYERLGFYEIPPYVYNPFEGARYLELKL